MEFDHDLLGRVGGYAVIDVVGTFAIAYGIARIWDAPVTPTIVAAFVIGEITHWAMGINTPLLTQAGITFFPAPAQGRHLNNRACNCH
jgi:hypothetical protein